MADHSPSERVKKMSEHPLSERQLYFLQMGQVLIEGLVDLDMADYVHECILQLKMKSCPDVVAHVRSEGGSLACGLQIYDEFVHYPGTATCIVNGFAHSAGALIVQGFQKRLSLPHSSFLIHHNKKNDATTLEDWTDERKYKTHVARLRMGRERAIAIWMKRTGKDRQKVVAQCNLDEAMLATEAKKFGLIDAIIEPPSA